MRRFWTICLMVVLLGTGVVVQAAWEMPPYQGVALIEMPIRKEPNSRSTMLEQVQAGELLNILSVEHEEWLVVQKGELYGYVYRPNVGGIHTTGEVPELLGDAEIDFVPLYTATARRRLVLREDPSRESRQMATVYENADVILGIIGEEWTQAYYDKKVGYLLTDYLTSLKVINPNWATLPGAHYYPYAARVVRQTAVIDADTNETLQVLPVGAVVNARIADQENRILVPYKRTWGIVRLQDVELLNVVTVEEAGGSDLIGVFATYFDNDPQNEIDVGRLFNIRKGVELFNGLRVPAGEEFSFNAIAAPYTQGNGYQRGPIINYTSDKKTGYGGGICQVSTTLYNVLLQLPMRIVTTRPHSSVGIDYAPVDYDAAVGAGNLDLIFQNMLPYEVEMRLQCDDGVITVMFYRAGAAG